MAKKESGDKGDLDEGKKPKTNGYTPKDVPVVKEADSDEDSFKKGGKVKKRKSGGHVEGKKEHKRMDKRASGGRMTGHSPLSSASKVAGRPGGDYSDSTDKADD